MAPDALSLERITKRFGSTLALDEATLHARHGTVHALLGENGAGKTTLMRVAYGMFQPDAGQVMIDGRIARLRSSADAIARGVGMVHQHFMIVPALDVAENVSLGMRGRYDRPAAAERVRALSGRVGLALDPEARVEDLGVGAQQRLEILKALNRDARVLVLDEPTAVLAPGEADELLRWLRAFAEQGHTVVLITHKLREALAVADDVTVLRHGRTVLTAPRDQVTADSLARSMIGDQAIPPDIEQASTQGEVVIAAKSIAVSDATGARRISDATLEVHSGEVLGIAGVEGSGHDRLLLALAGRAPISAGELRLPASVGFVPEDRHRDALILEFSLTENVVLSNAAQHTGRIRWSQWRKTTAQVLRDFEVHPDDADAAAGSLSGGNQQRLVLGRELRGAATALVAVNPTRGLDLRATAAIHDRLRRACSAGLAIVLHSSDLDEVLSLSTRMLVVHAGRVREVPRDRELVGKAMLGVEWP